MKVLLVTTNWPLVGGGDLARPLKLATFLADLGIEPDAFAESESEFVARRSVGAPEVSHEAGDHVSVNALEGVQERVALAPDVRAALSRRSRVERFAELLRSLP